MHKNKKEHLFDNEFRGIIESVEKSKTKVENKGRKQRSKTKVENKGRKHRLLERGLICMEKIDRNAHSVYQMYYHLIMVVKY